jgi:RHS repeat-associated protein
MSLRPLLLTYRYDAWNRLVTVNTSLASYEYDGLGRRISETKSGTTRDFYYSDQGQVLEERVGGQVQVQYVWSPVYVDALVLRARDTDGNPWNGLEEWLWVQQDANWNVTSLVANTNFHNVVERYVYDPFGAVSIYNGIWQHSAWGSYDWQYLHQGLRYDFDTRLYDDRARAYDPTEGRFISVDPMGFGAGDVDLYRYVGNGPTGRLDPSGLDPGWQFDPIFVWNANAVSQQYLGMNALPPPPTPWDIFTNVMTGTANAYLQAGGPVANFGWEAAGGFLGAAWHTATHPWEIVTAPVELAWNLATKPGETLDNMWQAFKRNPGKFTGEVGFGIVLGKKLGELGGKICEAQKEGKVPNVARMTTPEQIRGRIGDAEGRLTDVADELERLGPIFDDALQDLGLERKMRDPQKIKDKLRECGQSEPKPWEGGARGAVRDLLDLGEQRQRLRGQLRRLRKELRDMEGPPITDN